MVLRDYQRFLSIRKLLSLICLAIKDSWVTLISFCIIIYDCLKLEDVSSNSSLPRIGPIVYFSWKEHFSKINCGFGSIKDDTLYVVCMILVYW